MKLENRKIWDSLNDANHGGFQHQPRFHDERQERLRILERNENIDEIPFQNKEKYRDRLRENWDLRRKRSAGASEGFAKRILISFVAPRTYGRSRLLYRMSSIIAVLSDHVANQIAAGAVHALPLWSRNC